jgi:deazaflavin-dependent oxidoreductase (nitroreductase family)
VRTQGTLSGQRSDSRRCARVTCENAADPMVRRFLIALGTWLAGLAFFMLVLLLGIRAKSPFALRVVRAFNRRFANPRQMKTAGKPGAYAGVIRHIGRRSGAIHETPVGPFATDAGFVIALPYGTSSDWVKNVLAAGSATLVTEGQTYEVDQAEIVPLADVEHVVPEKDQRNLRLFRVEQAMRVRRTVAGDVR